MIKKYFVFIIFILFTLTSCKKNYVSKEKNNFEPISKQKFLLDTIVTITLYDTNNEKILNEAFDFISEYESLLSPFLEGSDIYNINNSNGEEIIINEKTAKILKEALKFCDISNGKFDITIGSLSFLWSFKDGGFKPSDSIIFENIKNVDYKNIMINKNKVTLLNPNIKIDLGAIAKGYITDELSNFLHEKGVTSAILNLGGNVYVIGSKYPDNVPFSVGIRKPFEDREEIIGKVEVIDKSVVSSGIYERFFYLDNNFYHHILDTKTGFPIKNDLSSITIISDKSLDGDALSTFAFTLGVDDALRMIENYDGAEAILINKNDEIFSTSGIGKKIPFTLKK